MVLLSKVGWFLYRCGHSGTKNFAKYVQCYVKFSPSGFPHVESVHKNSNTFRLCDTLKLQCLIHTTDVEVEFFF